jgi:hypothetical protein
MSQTDSMPMVIMNAMKEVLEKKEKKKKHCK